jgi:BNR/Asp-box repeat
MRRLGVVLVAVVASVLGGCGGEEEDTPETATSGLAVPWVDPDGDPPIVGSLSVNPADSVLYMGTNTGLFRIPEGSEEPERVTGRLRTPDGAGEVSESLVVRFTGPDQALASGHPAAGESLPQQLGLIATDDAGATWTPVSELGTADFHAIEPSGDTLVAALFQQPQVLVSEDDGRNWETRAAPMPLVSLEVDPSDARRWVGSTERGLFISRDAGGSWRPNDPIPNIRLAWAESGDLYRIDPGGPVKVSTDGGETWEERGTTGGEPQAMTVDGETLYVALIDGTVKRSTDGGQSFTDLVTGG